MQHTIVNGLDDNEHTHNYQQTFSNSCIPATTVHVNYSVQELTN